VGWKRPSLGCNGVHVHVVWCSGLIFWLLSSGMSGVAVGYGHGKGPQPRPMNHLGHVVLWIARGFASTGYRMPVISHMSGAANGLLYAKRS
jgi:hypothetical protein